VKTAIVTHTQARERTSRHPARSSCATDPRRADAAPAAVLTPETLARHFAVRAEVRIDSAGLPYVLPYETLDAGGTSEDRS